MLTLWNLRMSVKYICKRCINSINRLYFAWYYWRISIQQWLSKIWPFFDKWCENYTITPFLTPGLLFLWNLLHRQSKCLLIFYLWHLMHHRLAQIPVSKTPDLPTLTHLTHLPLDKMAAILQTIFSDAFSWLKGIVFLLKFHSSLLLRVQLAKTQLWFRQWLGAE